MRSHRLLWLLPLLSLLSACSVLTDFDPEGQACPLDGGKCLDGYVCVSGKCVTSSDGGTGGSSLCEDPEHCPEISPEVR